MSLATWDSASAFNVLASDIILFRVEGVVCTVIENGVASDVVFWTIIVAEMAVVIAPVAMPSPVVVVGGAVVEPAVTFPVVGPAVGGPEVEPAVCVREAFPEKNLLQFGHCPKGGGGSNPNPNCLRNFFFCLDLDIF